MNILILIFLSLSISFASPTVLLFKTDNPEYFKILGFQMNKSTFKDVEKKYKDIKIQKFEGKDLVCFTGHGGELHLIMQGSELIITDFILREKTDLECKSESTTLKIYDLSLGIRHAEVREKLGPAYQMPHKEQISYSKREPKGPNEELFTWLNLDLKSGRVVKIHLYRKIGKHPVPAKVNPYHIPEEKN